MKKNILLLFLTICILSIVFLSFKILNIQKSDEIAVKKSISKVVQIDSKTGSNFSFTSSIFNSPTIQSDIQKNPWKYPFIISTFDKVQTLEDYKKFNKFHSKEWIYIYAVKNKDKNLWTKIWSFDYDVNKYQSIFFKDKNEFLSRMNGFYDDIISWKKITYTPWNDISIYFSSSQDIKYLESLCLSEKKNSEEDKFISYCLNILYFAKANSENKLCNKISDSDEWLKSMKSLCFELAK
jgi:hypothetical protein